MDFKHLKQLKEKLLVLVKRRSSDSDKICKNAILNLLLLRVRRDQHYSTFGEIAP